MDTARDTVAALRARLLGLQSASMLAAKSVEYAQAPAVELPVAREQNDRAETARDDAKRESSAGART
jgi:chromosome segregation protein